jgi:2-aminoadipate transaminase
MLTAKRSAIREILKVTARPEIISFAGGLPNPDVFPVTELEAAASRVFKADGRDALQYSTTEGYLPLRQYIVRRYREKKGLKLTPDNILITTGSQQGLDLIAKAFINKGDAIVLERPGYLGAIQAFSLFEPRFIQVPLEDDGIDTERLEKVLKKEKPKIFYAVPTFQNPSGLSYSLAKRREVARLVKKYGTIFVEDDPYSELRFMGASLPPIRKFAGAGALLMGTFSKIVAPGLRLGWVCAAPAIMDKLVIAKQAADLHTNYLAQRIVYQHLMDNDLDDYLATVRKKYKSQRDLMVSLIAQHLPPQVSYTQPEGGMFLWLSLPEQYSSLELLKYAMKENVAFVPGDAFYTDGTGQNTFRLNFSNSDPAKIERGIISLARAMDRYFAAARPGRRTRR